jgi:hypothetical protein
MNDEDLTEAWTTLDPADTQRRRIASRVFAWLDAHDTSLAAEWLTLIRIAPFGTLGLVAASAVVLLFVSPIFWFARALAGVFM